MEGTYNFAVEDDEIDEGMFAGDRNSARVQEPRQRYMDPAALNHAFQASSELSEGEGIRLENYQPRVSPVSSFRNGTTVYTSVDVNGGGGRSSEPAKEKNADLEGAYENVTAWDTRREDLNNLSKPEGSAGKAISGSSSEDEDEPPDWVPPPPSPSAQNYKSPVYNDREDRLTSPDNLVKNADENASDGRSPTVPTSKQDSSENNDVDNRLTVNENEPQLYAQVDRSKKNQKANKESPDSARNELLTNGSLYDADTSEDDSMIWPPPPPPPQASNLHDDSDWERPLPPEIMALPGKRNRVAAWADDD